MMRTNGTYTKNEMALLKILRSRRGRRIDTKEITRLHYADRSVPPVYASRSVVVVLNYLIKKVAQNDESFLIDRTPRAGPKPNEYWIVSRRKVDGEDMAEDEGVERGEVPSGEAGRDRAGLALLRAGGS